MLSCKQVTSLATDYMEGAVPWRTWLQMRLHLAMCWMCRRYLQQLALTSRALNRLSARDVPQPAPDSLREMFRQWQSDRGK